jgi:thiamine pyrophosphokinase
MPASTPHVLIVGSVPLAATDLARYCARSDLIICADGGGTSMVNAGLRPSVLIGDMDSIDSAAHRFLVESGTIVIEHAPEKDKTDLELALEYALAQQPASMTIAGGLGGERLDHSLGNLLLLALPSLRDLDVRLVDHTAEALSIWTRRQIKGQPGEYVSLLPLTPTVEGVSTSGLRYPLHAERLVQGHTRGVSNELVEPIATISVEAGCLLAIHQYRLADASILAEAVGPVEDELA